ncbi:hypothetical protein AB3X93_35225, partial [Paraburkholderia sp. BR14262]
MRLKRLLAAWLCASLTVSPQAYAQASNAAVLKPGAAPPMAAQPAPAPSSPAPNAANAAPALVSGPFDDSADPVVPASIAQGVFGTYGGAQSRFSAQGQAGAASSSSSGNTS